MVKGTILVVSMLALGAWCSAVHADHKWGLKPGKPELQSAGQLAFGPDGVLFIGDAKGARLFAIDTQDTEKSDKPAKIDDLVAALAKLYDGAAVTVNDLAINPQSGNVYLSVAIGEEKQPGIVRIAGSEPSIVALDEIPFQQVALPNPPEDKITGEGPRAKNRRSEAITDLVYAEGKLLVAGLTGAAAPSTVREIAFPFADADQGTNVEIYHAAHGRVEDYAAIRTFIPLDIDGQPSLLAGFTCTPLVRFPVDGLTPGSKIRGTTVAELGNRNQPLDMILYEKGGERFVLMANTARGVMKISTQGIGRADGLADKVDGGGTAGQTFETIKDLNGTTQLDKLNDTQAIAVIQTGEKQSIKVIELP